MPSKSVYYQIHTPNNRSDSSKKSWLTKTVKNQRKKRLITSVLGVYTIVAGILGYSLYTSVNDTASAKEPGLVSTSLRIVDEKEYKNGDEVELALTLQNTSVTDSITNLNAYFYSTNSSVKWESVQAVTSSKSSPVIKGQSNVFGLPVLSPGERVEYQVTGILQDSKFSYLAMQAKLGYDNINGDQEAATNKVFTKLDSTNNGSGDLLTLAPSKSAYGEKDEVYLDLVYEGTEENVLAPIVDGKIYISNKNTQDVVSTLDCSLGDFSICSASVTGLKAGQYSALFIDDTETVYSEIAEFKVKGNTAGFVPTSTSSFDTPFGSSSINGIAPVIAKRVMNLNTVPDGEKCKFEAIQESKIIKTFEAKVEKDRSCYTTISTADLKNEVYTIRLGGTSLTETVSFLDKSANLISLEDKTPVLKTGGDVEIEAVNIKSLTETEEITVTDPDTGEETIETVPADLNDAKVTLGIWHPRTGEYKEVKTINSDLLKVNEGIFNATIPSTYFDKGGYYSIYINIEDGQQSDFLGLSFNDNEVGFSNSGVIVENYADLKVGSSTKLKLTGVTDKSGNLINEAECAASVYQRGAGAGAVTTKGQIKEGVCSVTIPAGKVTKSGPALVTFSGTGINNGIDQARQVEFAPGIAVKFGSIQLEYEPAREGYANNLIVGPVTDKYGNLTNAFGYQVKIYNKEGKELKNLDVDIVDGFAKITVPASYFTEEIVDFKLVNTKEDLKLERTVAVEKVVYDKLILPNFPTEINSDDSINVGITGLNTGEPAECKLTYIKAERESISEVQALNVETGSCEFNWNLTKLRENKQGMLKLTIGEEKAYYGIVSQASGEPSSLFVVAPQVKVNDQNELEIALLTSPITDRNGLPVENTKIRFEYNGEVEEVTANNGFAKLELTANKLQSKDIRNVLAQRYLDIGLDVKAGVTSISKTYDLSLFLGTKDVANARDEFATKKASTQIYSQSREIFKFKTEQCDAAILSDRGVNSNVKTHWQGGDCYVEVAGNAGEYTLLFEENGFDVGEFKYLAKDNKSEVSWCSQSPCQLQVLSSIRGNIEAYLYDGDNQYKFESESLDNLITVKQNGLSPLKDYLVEVRFEDNEGNQVSVYDQIPGELIAE